MINPSTTASSLTDALTSPGWPAAAVILAIAALLLALSIGLAIVKAAKQGRIDVRVTVNLGRNRQRPP